MWKIPTNEFVRITFYVVYFGAETYQLTATVLHNKQKPLQYHNSNPLQYHNSKASTVPNNCQYILKNCNNLVAF